MAEKVMAGSVPMATATSMRWPAMRVATTWGTLSCGAEVVPPAVRAMSSTSPALSEAAGAEVFAGVLGGYLLTLPVHAGGVAVVYLHAVHAEVALAGFGIAGGDAGEGDEAAAVSGPGLEDGEFQDVDVVAAADDFFAGSLAGVDDFGKEAADFGELWEKLELVEHAGGGDGVEEGVDALGDVVEGVDFEGETHAAFAAELVHQDVGAGIAGDVFEEERGTAGAVSSLP